MKKFIFSLLLGAFLLPSCKTASYGCPATRGSSGYTQSHVKPFTPKGNVVATGFGTR
jgi:hypothetical protein